MTNTNPTSSSFPTPTLTDVELAGVGPIGDATPPPLWDAEGRFLGIPAGMSTDEALRIYG